MNTIMDKVAEKFERLHPTLHIVGEVPKNRNGNVVIHCDICGQNFTRKRYGIAVNRTDVGCPVCKNKFVVKGYNDIATTDSWMVEYFKDKEEAFRFTSGSSKRVELKCPICGSERTCEVYSLKSNGFKCYYCNDSVSFPNKFSRAILSQLPIKNLTPEYSPKWISPKRYDNYFEYNGNKYILEMDGGFHYMDNTYNEKIKLENVKENDKYKDKLAEEHGIYVIRIDCRKLEPSEIRLKIENSMLSEIFDLSIIDWEKCQLDATKNLIFRACELFENGMMIKDIAKEIGVRRQTVREYLKRGNEIGIVKYDKTIKISHYKLIDIYKESDNTFIGTCNYYRKIGTLLSSLNPNETYNICSIRKHVINKTPYKGYIFVERET